MYNFQDWFGVAAILLLLVSLAAAEIFSPLHRSPRDDPGRLRTNFSLSLLNLISLALLPITAIVAAEWARSEDFGLLRELPDSLAVAATLVVRSLLAYGLHRLAHSAPLLWRFHRVHHADTALDLSTSLRHHPVELLYVALVGAAVAALLGLSPTALVAYEIAAAGFVFWSHANMRLPARLDALLSMLVATPAVHHVHHSARQSETDSNYGDVFTLWDRAFGTYRRLPDDRLEALRPGLGDAHDGGASNLLVQLKSPLQREPG